MCGMKVQIAAVLKEKEESNACFIEQFIDFSVSRECSKDSLSYSGVLDFNKIKTLIHK